MTPSSSECHRLIYPADSGDTIYYVTFVAYNCKHRPGYYLATLGVEELISSDDVKSTTVVIFSLSSDVLYTRTPFAITASLSSFSTHNILSEELFD